MAAVQLATAMGAEATGISSPSKAELVKSAGAVDVIARGAPIVQDTYDAVIDVVGGEAWMSLIDALKPGGHYAVAGAIGGPIVEADLRRIYLRDITIHGCTYQPPEVFAALIDMVNTGSVRPLISGTYPMQDITRAQEDFQSKRFAGKLVLLPPE
jgi:alcohol dehydrogenase